MAAAGSQRRHSSRRLKPQHAGECRRTGLCCWLGVWAALLLFLPIPPGAAGTPSVFSAPCSPCSPGLRRFFLALVPIATLAAVFEGKHLQSERETAEREAAAVAAGQAPPPRANVRGGTTSHGVDIDPANPLHKVLPETDCEFCLETREKLWGMVKAMKHEKKAAAGAGAAPAAEASRSGGNAGNSSGSSSNRAPAPAPAAAD